MTFSANGIPSSPEYLHMRLPTNIIALVSGTIILWGIMFLIGMLWAKNIQPKPVPAQPPIWVGVPDSGAQEYKPNYDNDCRSECDSSPV
jgi:hypothetical protein